MTTDFVSDAPRPNLIGPIGKGARQRQPGAGPGWPSPSGIANAVSPRERARRQQGRAKVRLPQAPDSIVEERHDEDKA